MTSDLIGLLGGTNTYAYVGSNPLRYGDPLGLVRVVVEGGVPASVVVRVTSHLDALESGLASQTLSCPEAALRYDELFRAWTVVLANTPASGFPHAGMTDGRINRTVIPLGSGTLNDLAHEFYHTTPENINISEASKRGLVTSNALEETGLLGAQTFADAFELGDCLCGFVTGESVRPRRGTPARPGVFDKRFWEKIFGISR